MQLLKNLNTHRYYYLFTQQAMYIQITNAICIHQKLLFYSLFFLCYQTNISLKSGIYKSTLDYFGHERSEEHWSLLNIHIYTSNIFWSTFEITFLAYFQKFSEKTGKKCLPAIRKRSLISEFIFNSLLVAYC